jgi:hypothetical protein
MNGTEPKRASLWRDALRDLLFFAKAEGQWIAIFAVVAAIEQILLFTYHDPHQIMDQLKQARENPAASLDIVIRFMPFIVLSAAANLATAMISAYFFTVLFLRRFAQANAPEFSFRNFFFWFGKAFQKYLILLFPLILVGVVFVFGGFQKPADAFGGVIAVASVLYSGGAVPMPGDDDLGSLGAANLLLLFLFNLWFFYYYYAVFLLYLVSPLAVLRDKTVLKTSAQITKKHLGRVWWDSVIVWTVMFVLFSPFFLADMSVSRAWGESSSQARGVSALIQGAWGEIADIAMIVYACVAYRVLLREQRDARQT